MPSLDIFASIPYPSHANVNKCAIKIKLFPFLSLRLHSFCSIFTWFGSAYVFVPWQSTNAILGRTGHVARQFFPYVSSESDLQRYKAISFRQHSANVSSDQHGSSSLSNVPSDYKSDRIKVSRYRLCREKKIHSKY